MGYFLIEVSPSNIFQIMTQFERFHQILQAAFGRCVLMGRGWGDTDTRRDEYLIISSPSVRYGKKQMIDAFSNRIKPILVDRIEMMTSR